MYAKAELFQNGSVVVEPERYVFKLYFRNRRAQRDCSPLVAYAERSLEYFHHLGRISYGVVYEIELPAEIPDIVEEAEDISLDKHKIAYSKNARLPIHDAEPEHPDVKGDS